MPKTAYDRLVKAGLDKKIKEKKRDVSNLLLFGFDEKIAEIIEKAKSDLSESSSFEKRRVAEEIVCLNDKLDEDDLFDILKATYRFFARDRTLLPKIMDYFLSEKQIP